MAAWTDTVHAVFLKTMKGRKMKVTAISKKIDLKQKGTNKPSLEARIKILGARISAVENLASSLLQGRDLRGLE